MTRLSFCTVLLILTAASPTPAQLDPGGYGAVEVVYSATDMQGALTAEVYVPGPGHAEYGRDIWRWQATPWQAPFRLKRTHVASARPSAATGVEQIFPGGALRPFQPRSRTVRYNWVISDAQNRPIGYVWRDGDRLDWWSTQDTAFLPAELLFAPKKGRLETRHIKRARLTTRIDVGQPGS